MNNINLGGGDAPAKANGVIEKSKQKKPRERGWIAPRYLLRRVPQRKSGIPRSTASAFVKRSDISQIRGPWIPAPARSTGSVPVSDAGTGQQQILDNVASSSSTGSSPEKIEKEAMESKVRVSASSQTVPSTSKEQLHVKRPTSKIKTTKTGARKTTSSHKLPFKDSLVDVTNCLQEKREDVMKLWQNTLLRDDPTLLPKIESVNKLALEAAEEVEALRTTIQTLQKKTDGLSDNDCSHLNELRTKVLSKVKDFEEADRTLKETIIQTSKMSIASAASKTSQTDQPGPHEDISKNVIFLKEKLDNYSISSNSELEDMDGISEIQAPPLLSDRSNPASAVQSVESLSKLKLLYEESFTFPSPSQEKISRSQSCTTSLEKRALQHQARKIRFNEEKTSSPEDLPDNQSTDDLYRATISHLQRKLMNTEEEMEELKSDMERIESDTNFRVKILQTTLQDKFESLKEAPEYLQADISSVHVKTELYQTEKLLREEKDVTRSLRKEVDDLKEKLRSAENVREIQTFKNGELEKSNIQLRKDVQEAMQRTVEVTSQLQKLKEESIAMPRSPRFMENQRLKLKCSELKEELGQAKRIIQMLKKSKSKLATDLNQRIDELLEMLQTAQQHKRLLGNQIRYLKKSYNELFPCNCDAHGHGHHHHRRRSTSTKNVKSRAKLEKELIPVEEPIIEAKRTWTTGKDRGILTDNLLDMPLDYLSLKNNQSRERVTITDGGKKVKS